MFRNTSNSSGHRWYFGKFRSMFNKVQGIHFSCFNQRLFISALRTDLKFSDSQNTRGRNIPLGPKQEPSALIWFLNKKNDRYHIDSIFRWRTGKSICQLMHLLKWEQARQNENVILEPRGSGKLPPGSMEVFGICYFGSENNKPPRNYDLKKAPSLPYIPLSMVRNWKCGHMATSPPPPKV